KCHIGYHSLEILGHMVDRLGLCTTQQKAEAIHKLADPESLQDLEYFIGMANWHRSLIPFFAQRLEPLQKLK
ncbi:hypothetical protein BJ508DRAFT_186305, partial [Ascobolus immersus RN42]